jgi:hypothetical protein
MERHEHYFVDIKKITSFSKPYMVAGQEASVDLITFLLAHDVHSASYKRRLRLDEKVVMTEKLQGIQSYLSETQPIFHWENSILRSLHFSAMLPYFSVPSTGSKQAEMGVI